MTTLSPAHLLADLNHLGIAAAANAPLAAHSTWHIGGPADLLVEPASIGEVCAVVQYARAHGLALLVIGQGSNLLFDDAGLRGIVLKIGTRLASLEVSGRRISAEAGVWVPRLARAAQRAGLAGLEHIIGIPGTVGGLVVMNGGSRRQGIGDNVRRVWVVDREGNPGMLSREECHFGYRSSALQGSGALVVRVELEGLPGDAREIRHEMLADLRERRGKFPRKEPNCGSVFLSTAAMHASVGPPGKIIEEAGLKGTVVGAAEISRRHANFIVNKGGATSRDVLDLIAHIRRVVLERIGFELHCEVRYVDPRGGVFPADRAPGAPAG
jgi:UDP-N-acetylmuramate dehydrogenase